MQFAQRTAWNTEPSDLALAIERRRQSGQPLYDLTASNPTRCGFTYDSSLLTALSQPAAFDYDAQPRGALSAREAVCKYYGAHGVVLSPEQIILTTSTSEAYSFLFRLMCDPGSEVLVPGPSYPLFDYLATLDDVRLSPAPLVYDHGWQIEPEGFRRAITRQTRAILLVHPNNPTGHFTKPWEAEVLAELCRKHNLALIVDEVFLDYGVTEQGSSFAAGLEGVDVFVVSGMSKIAGLPQMKAAWIASIGPHQHQALERLEVIADTFLSMNAPVQCALPTWLELRHGLQQQIKDRVAQNLAVLDQLLATSPQVTRLTTEGGWYAVLRIPALRADEETVLALVNEGVSIHPGCFFGMPPAGWLVASLLAPEDEFRAGAERLIKAVGGSQ